MCRRTGGGWTRRGSRGEGAESRTGGASRVASVGIRRSKCAVISKGVCCVCGGSGTRSRATRRPSLPQARFHPRNRPFRESIQSLSVHQRFKEILFSFVPTACAIYQCSSGARDAKITNHT